MLQSASIDTARAALSCISPNLTHDEWLKVGMALHSEFPGEDGFEVFDGWSQLAPDQYNRQNTKATWKSFKAGGAVGLGTLFHMAKQQGFVMPKPGENLPSPDPAQLAMQRAERQSRQKEDLARQRRVHEEAAAEADNLWATGQDVEDTSMAPYLVRKGVSAHGVRFMPPGTLLVPLRDATGQLWNVQRILPNKPQVGSPDKFFVKGGRKSGLWHQVGDLSDAGTAVLLVGEGYATAATLHEATQYPVAVAFDAGNLAKVVKALAKAYPAALLVVCGDDDRETEARTGVNPGRVKALAAAASVGGLAVFPEGLPPGGSDFNDLYTHLGGADGLEAVRATVQSAIDAHNRAAEPRNTAPGGKGARQPQKAPAGPTGETAQEWDRFTVNDGGVFHRGVDRDGNPTKPEWVCSRLEVEAMTRDQEGNGWGYLLTFADSLQRTKQWAMPARMLSGDGGEYRAKLYDMGLRITASPRARNLLTQYIQTRSPEAMALCTEKTGWHGRAFVLPHETVGGDDERIVFQTDTAMENTFRVKGTAAQWRDRVAALCQGNSRLVFAVASALAGPLLRPAGVESGGFHFRGDSSSGKTTALKVAASVWGGASYLQRWRTTDNALEAIAAQHSDGLLILDELAQVDPKTAGECAYMLANEQSKARATRNGAPRPRLSWRLLFLSAGELGLADHMAEGMKRTRTGQEVRMADIPADAGVGLGAFEQIHGHEGGAAFSTHLVGQAATVYGAAGRAWLDWLTTNVGNLKAMVRETAAAQQLAMVPEASSGQVHRVAARFALVGAAGEMATAAGLTGWPKGESERAARTCFNAWLAARGGNGNGEVAAMLRQVRRFLELHGEGRFTWWDRAYDDHNAKTLHRAGFRRLVNDKGEPLKEKITPLNPYPSVEFFVMPETFRAEVCQGFDHEAVCKVLSQHGLLLTNEPGRYAKKVKLPSVGLTRCYHIPPSIFSTDV